MKQQLVVTVLGKSDERLVERLARAIQDCGAGIQDCRMGTLAGEFAAMIQLSGSWSVIAKFEGLIPKLEQDLDVRISSRRTAKIQPVMKRMPYTIEIISGNRDDVIHKVSSFLVEAGVDICELYANTYQSPHTDMLMLSVHIIVNIPSDTSIAALRTEFMDFCDHLNLDGIMEPTK